MYIINFSVSNIIDSNMVIDETVDTTSNDASVIENDSPQTKLFPIFTNQTPSPNHIVR